ncbi:MAG: radical SAM protein [Nitrospirae bacterium]|nr:radical SAM protein [Nitrospirota bacterium]
MILINPPVAKPCEPPAGIARLSGMLNRHGVEHTLLDANIEGLLYLLGLPLPSGNSDSAWTKRSFRNCGQNISALRDPRLYQQLDRYKRAVKDIGRVLHEISPSGISVGLADYADQGLSPVKSADLLMAADKPRANPFYPYFSARLRELFSRRKPAMVGISLNYLSQALCTFSMIGFMRREFPGLTIVLGGGLVTSWMKNLAWQNPFAGLVDHVIAGPGEYQLIALLGKTSEEETWPLPDYQSLPRNEYLSPGFILPYSASSGCYWNRCDFCPEEAEQNPYILIPPKQVISDLKELAARTNPSLIHLLDNAISPALLEAFCEEKPGVPWYGFARVGRHLADPEFCMALKQAGCVMLKLGIESGDQGVLDALRKGISLEMTSVVLKNLRQAGIATYVYLLFGTPVENEASARKTLEFTAQHSDCINYLNLAIFNMPVCSKSSAELKMRNFSEGDLSLYTDFQHPQGWDRKKVRLFLDREFKRHPAVASILKKELPVFTSNHAPFFRE